jgi:putative restriction endonuclease
MTHPIEAILRLTPQHQRALTWFVDYFGRKTTWPDTLPDGTLLATRAKGIYKPAWSAYALSVRQTIDAPYADRDPILRRNGSWIYLYHQEGDQLSRDEHFTNVALMACLRDGVPIGVMRQVSLAPSPEYEVLGLAIVTGWGGGYFVLEGVPQGAVST